MKSYGKDLTSGSVPKNLIRFAIPVFIANLLSSGYSIINTIWVGHLLGGIAVAAVAVIFPVVLFMVAIANAATTATSVLIAHNYGAGKNDAIQDIVNTSWTFGFILVVVFCIAGIAGAGSILQMMGTNVEVRNTALPFLQLTILQFIFMYCAFLFSSVLRAVGNSKVPLLFTAIGTGLNAILDPMLISGIGPFPQLGLNGAATASLVSNGITSIAAFVYFWKKYDNSPLLPRRIGLRMNIVGQISGIGMPSFIQQTILSVTMGILTVFVNRFGPSATAAFGITGRMESMVIFPSIATMIAVSTLTAQALGAGKNELVPRIYRWGLLIDTPILAVISVAAIVFPSYLMRLFVADPEIIGIGVRYLQVVGWGYLLLVVIYVNNGVIIGSKKTMVTMVVSIASLACFRIPLAALLCRTGLGITGIWIAIVLSFFVNAVLGFSYYLSGKWMPLKPKIIK